MVRVVFLEDTERVQESHSTECTRESTQYYETCSWSGRFSECLLLVFKCNARVFRWSIVF